MPRVQQVVQPIQVDYVCEECGKGHYRLYRSKPMMDPPEYLHKCDECGDSKCFNETYPCIRYAPERDLLNLDDYVQQT